MYIVASLMFPYQELEEDAEAEVEKILFELTKGELGTGTAINTPISPQVEEEMAGPAAQSSEEEDDLQSRLAALRS